MGFSRQEYWSGLPFPSPRDLPRDRTRVSHIGGRRFNLWTTREVLHHENRGPPLCLTECYSDGDLRIWVLTIAYYSECAFYKVFGKSRPGLFSQSIIPSSLRRPQCCSVAQSCPTLCDPMDYSMSGFPVHHQLPELAQTHVHWVDDANKASHPLSPPSPPFLNLSEHQGLFQWVGSSHQVAKVLQFQLWH